MISIRVDTTAAVKSLSAVSKQIPFATARAINDVAFQVMRAENAAMTTVFAHPRPFTQRATQVERKATKGQPTAIVSLRPTQERYLDPYEFGGPHALPGSLLLQPVDAKLDPYGQLPKGAIQRFASDPTVFFGTVRGVTGFWQRPKVGTRRGGDRGTKGAVNKVGAMRTTLKLLLRVGVNRPVTKHLEFEKRAVDVAAAAGPAAVAKAVDHALATLR